MYKHIIKIILCFIVTSSVIYSGGFQLNEHGARALAQSGAFAARANDASAMYFNPAGIAHLDGTQLMLGTTLIFPDISFTYRDPVSSSWAPVKYKASKQIFTPFNLHFTHKINDMFTAGLAVYNPYGFGTEWTGISSIAFFSIKAEIQLFNFNPTIATKLLDDKLSIGTGFNYTIGSFEMLRMVAYPITLHLKSGLTDGVGYGYNFGLQYKVTPSFIIDASYRSPMDVEIEGNATLSMYDPTISQGKVKSTLKLPANIFLAVACSPTDNLWLEFDAQFIGWSSFDKLEMIFENYNNYVNTIEKNYKNTWIFRLGAEYKLSESLTISGGCFRDINPVPDETLDPMLPDSDRWGINLGVSYQVTKMLSVDLTYVFLPFDERTTNIQKDYFKGTYNITTNLFGFNINFNF